MIKRNTYKKRNYFKTRKDLLVCLLLGFITFAVYCQVINHEFISLDDDLYVTENQHILEGITLQSVAWAFNFSDKEETYWHPLTWLSHNLDCQLYGLNSGMHHLTSLIIHMANAILLFLLFNRMTGELWKSAFVAAIFSLHPINVDSVAWVAERKNVLSTFFWILTMLSYVHYTVRPGIYKYLLTLFVFALGLLAKPMLVTLPCVLILIDYWPLGRILHSQTASFSRLIIEKIPFFLLSFASIFLSTSSLKGTTAVISMIQRPMDLRIANALVSYVSYIGKMIWPQGLAVNYPFPATVPIWESVCAGLFLILVSLLVFISIKRMPYLTIGWLWFIGTLVPVIGLMQVGYWPALADRFAYVPFIGLFVMVAWGVPDLFVRWRFKERSLVLIAAVFLSIIITTTFVEIFFSFFTSSFIHLFCFVEEQGFFICEQFLLS